MKSILKSRRALVGGATAIALSAIGVGVAAAPASAASESAWDRVAACESGGDWSIDTGNGYYGGLQFSMSTWRAYGGTGSPSDASKSTQIAVAEKVLAGQGWGAWPVCSVKAGVTGQSASTSSSSSSSGSSSHSSSHSTSHASPAPAAPRHVTSVRTSGRTYTVVSGDTLGTIAQRLHVSGGWERLADANTATVSDPDLIYPGQVLQLPA